jgi:hypothetical protein
MPGARKTAAASGMPSAALMTRAGHSNFKTTQGLWGAKIRFRLQIKVSR